MNSTQKLIFVYNAKGGLFATITDYVHKNLSPATYECNLCSITYDNLGMKKEWKDFLNNLEIEKVFLHKEEFAEKYPEFKSTALPAIFIENENSLDEVLDSEQLNQTTNVADLITELSEVLTTKIGLNTQ
jgi:hypothetical protein